MALFSEPSRGRGDLVVARVGAAHDISLRPPLHLGRCCLELEALKIDRARQTLLQAPQAESSIRGLVQELWYLARLVRQDGRVCTELHSIGSDLRTAVEVACEAVNLTKPSFSNGLAARLAEALSTIGYRDLGLFELIVERVQEGCKDLSGKQLCRLLWAMAQLDVVDMPRLTDTLIKAVRSAARIESIDISTRARMGLALAHLKEGGVRAVLAPHFLDGYHCSIRQWGEIYRALVLDKQISPFDELDPHREGMRNALFKLEMADTTFSRLEQRVEERLRKFLVMNNVEFSLAPQENVAGLFVDLMLRLPAQDRTIAIEADGMQYHFTWGPDGGVRRGIDTIKRRILEAHGLEVFNITSDEWNRDLGERFFSELVALPIAYTLPEMHTIASSKLRAAPLLRGG